MNFIGWILAATGLAGVISSIAGIAFILVSQRSPINLTADFYFHDTYYVISRPYYSIWPLLLCIALSVALSLIGYMHTELFMRQALLKGNNSSGWTVYPDKAEPDAE